MQSVDLKDTSIGLAKGGKLPHDVSLDGVRVVATLMVLLIHISGKGFAGMAEHWWAINTYESVSRICVPLFFMITGALLLPKSSSIESVISRVWRIVFVLFAWSFIYFVYYKFHGPTAANWFAAIVREPVAGHFWYLYTLIVVYFFIPVLASFFNVAQVRLQIFILVVWFLVSSLIPVINRFFETKIIGLDTAVFYIYPAYVLAGGLIYKHLKATRSFAIFSFILWVASTALTGFLTWYYSKDKPVNTELFYEYFSPLVVIATLAAFVCVRYFSVFLANKIPGVRSLLISLGGLSFGVYLVHPIIIWVFEGAGYGWNFTNPWLAIPALLVGVSVVSGAITWCIRKIPYLRSIVPG